MIEPTEESARWMFSSKEMPREVWEMVRLLVLQRDDYTCRMCGLPGDAPTAVLQCDHIVPRSLGGTNSPYNLQTLCKECNIRKGALPPTFVITEKGWKMWHNLLIAEPRLLAVYHTARCLKDDFSTPGYCANLQFFIEGRIKERLTELVGWNRGKDTYLGTQEAYDTAYEVIYNALPYCRNCMCADSTMLV